jgi:hypothetical protein
MPNTTNPNSSSLTEILAMAPNARQDLITAFFHKAACQYSPLMNFTSTFDPNAEGKGVTSIFAEKTDLRAGGKSRVHFNTIGMPAGNGAIGAQTLVGKESKATIGTYAATVDWVRDATSLTQDEIEMIEAGRNLKGVLLQMLAKKMTLTKDNHMFQRLKLSAVAANTYRVGNRSSTNGLTPDDVLSTSVSNICRSKLNTLGATPLMKNTAKAGCPINKFMLFASDTAFLPIRNSSPFTTAITADVRGRDNANFTGEILDWQGNPHYEFPITDMAWDGYKGGPLLAKAVVSVAQTPASSSGAPKLIVNADNTDTRYFEWFDGHPFQFSRQEALPNLSANEYYFWACNPDGSRVFGAYNGLNAALGGNQIAITKILCPGGVSGTTVDHVTVGDLNVGSTAAYASGTAGVFTVDGDIASGKQGVDTAGPDGTFVLTDTIQDGAVILQANSQGTVYSRSFMFGSMAAMFAHGRIKMAEIEQNFDYDYVMGKGFQMIFGTGVALDPNGVPNGYILIEHAIDVVGYPCPTSFATTVTAYPA